MVSSTHDPRPSARRARVTHLAAARARETPLSWQRLSQHLLRQAVRAVAQILESDLAIVLTLVHGVIVQVARARAVILGLILLVTLRTLLLGVRRRSAVAAGAERRAERVGVMREHAADMPYERFVSDEHELNKHSRRAAVLM